MNETKEFTVKVQVPAGWRPKENLMRIINHNEHYLDVGNAVSCWTGLYPTSRGYVPLEREPIDTTTEEYRLEVHRQWLPPRNRKIQFKHASSLNWSNNSHPTWNWIDGYIYRVKPHGTDEIGPYYMDGDKKVRVPS